MTCQELNVLCHKLSVHRQTCCYRTCTGRLPNPGNIQGQAGWGSEQPNLVEDSLAHCKGIGLDAL